MGDDRPAILRPVGFGDLVDRVEGHPDAAVADGMDMDLDPGPVESGHQRIHLPLPEVGDTGTSAAVQVWGEQSCGLGFDHAVGEELGRAGRVVFRTLVALSPGNQRIHLREILLRIDVLGGEDPGGDFAGPVERGVSFEQLGVGRGFVGGGDPELIGEDHCLLETVLALLEAVGRQEPADQ